MATSVKHQADLEPISDHHSKLLCWKSIFAGLLISIMSYMLLSALGAGIGGVTASHLISNEKGGSGFATGAGLWLGISMVISLFLGSYFALRISKFLTNKVGAAHGFVIASLFFILMTWGAAKIVGGVSQGLGGMANALGNTTADVSQNPAVQDTIQKSLSNSNLKSDPSEVAQGLATRLLQGDTESAKAYYAYQTGLSQSEVDGKISQMKAEFDAKAKIAAEKAANAVADAGWGLFAVFLAGLIGAVMGGRTGAQANNERPFARKIEDGYTVPTQVRV